MVEQASDWNLTKIPCASQAVAHRGICRPGHLPFYRQDSVNYLFSAWIYGLVFCLLS